MIADELRRQADSFIDLADMQSKIARQLPVDRSRSGDRLRQDGSGADHYVNDDDEYYEDEAVYLAGQCPSQNCRALSRAVLVSSRPERPIVQRSEERLVGKAWDVKVWCRLPPAI